VRLAATAFFDFLKGRIVTARKYAPAARDYAMFRMLYHAGLRTEEAVMLDRPDVHFGRGPFGKLHVRFGKGAKTSGPRPRWGPMLDGVDLVLRWSSTMSAAGSRSRRCCFVTSPVGGWPRERSGIGCGT